MATATQQKPEECAVKVRLTNAYAAASEDFNRAVIVLMRYTGVTQKAKYTEMLRSPEEARERTQQAHAALEAHVAGHGC